MAVPVLRIIVNNDNGTLLVNSRAVAEHFDRRHDNVLASIDELVTFLGPEKSGAYFRERSDYHGAARKDVRSFDLTRRGFILLVMGWTGEKALPVKIAYIEEFDRMEEELRRRAPQLIDDQRMRELMLCIGGRFDGMEGKIDKLDVRVGLIEDRLTKRTKTFGREAKEIWRFVIRKYYGGCDPSLPTLVNILDDAGNYLPGVRFDHHLNRQHSTVWDGWPVNSDARNIQLRGYQERDQARAYVQQFHDRIKLHFPDGRMPRRKVPMYRRRARR